MSPIICKESAARLIASSIPEAEWLLDKIESDDGWFRFPSVLVDAIKNLKIDSYPLLYENERSITRMLELAFVGEANIDEFNIEFARASLQKRDAMLGEILIEFDEFMDSVDFPKTPEQQSRAKGEFDALSKEEQSEAILFAQRWYCFFFASFFQNLSMMVHGEKLTSLVAQAKNGNDEAFVKAVQIDRRILITIPYFKERFARAQDEGDTEFSDKIAYRLKCAPYKGKIRFKSLWLTFSLLDQLGLLDTLTHSEVLEICDKAGVGGEKNRIDDVKTLTKRLKDYRLFQKRGVVSTH